MTGPDPDHGRLYRYPAVYRLLAYVAPAVIIGVMVYLMAFPLLNDRPLPPGRYPLILAVGTPFTLLFALATHMMYPAVRLRDDGLRLETPLHTGRWIGWDELTRIRVPTTNFTTQICTVGIPRTHPVYTLIGYTQGFMSPAFLIHPNIQNGERLMRTLIKKRPDLFPQ